MGKTYKDRDEEEEINWNHFQRRDRKAQKSQEIIEKINKEIPVKEKQ